MKFKLFIICMLALSSVLFSCRQEIIEGITDSDLVGTWRLSEVYVDPGGGVVNFQEVDSDAEIEFFTNGSFRTNFDICNFAQESGNPVGGRYFLEDKSLIVNPPDCENGSTGSQTTYAVDRRELIITFRCFEGCAQKFRKQ